MVYDSFTFWNFFPKKKITFKYDEKPSSRILKIQNLHLALKFLEREMDVKLVGIGAEDFADHNLKMILGFLWSLFKKYRIQTIKTDDKSSEEGLLLWVKKTTDGYRDISIESYKHSFKDGMAFLALCDKYIGTDKTILDYSQFKREDNLSNLIKAFEIAESKIGIPRLLEPQEVVDQNVDERSLVLYISLYFHAFVAQQQQKGIKEEKQRIEGRLKGLQEELEGRARSAAELVEENAIMRRDLDALRNQLKAEQEAKAELQEKDSYLEEKVEVLKQLLDQENEEKEEMEQTRQNLEKELEELKQKFEQLSLERNELKQNFENGRKMNLELSTGKSSLEDQKSALLGQMSDLTSKFETLNMQRSKENEEHQSRSRVEVKGLEILKKNLEEHIEDLHRWQKYLDYDKQSEIDFSGEIRPQILAEISKQNYDDQLQYLAKKLDVENSDLLKFLKQKELEIKSKKALEKKKKERVKKSDT